MSTEASDQETMTAELKRKIGEAFDIFDHESNKTVDVREIGTIVRSLNCCPSEAELGDILNDIEEDEPTGYIRFEKFENTIFEICKKSNICCRENSRAGKQKAIAKPKTT